MKKFIALLLALCMAFALCACGDSTSASTTAPAADKSTEAADTTAAEGTVHIGIVTGSVSQSEDDRRGA